MTYQGDGLHREALEERAAIVAWLRKLADLLDETPSFWRWTGSLYVAAMTLRKCAKTIERADHMAFRDAAASGEVD